MVPTFRIRLLLVAGRGPGDGRPRARGAAARASKAGGCRQAGVVAGAVDAGGVGTTCGGLRPNLALVPVGVFGVFWGVNL